MNSMKMEKGLSTDKNTRHTIKTIWDLIFSEIRPIRLLLEEIQIKLNDADKSSNDPINKIWNVYTLCRDQIRKCVLIIIEILNNKKESNGFEHVQESLQCVSERLLCCHHKLLSIDEYIDELLSPTGACSGSDDSIVMNTMYFVNWIDQTFEILGNLSNIVYRYDCQTSAEVYDVWKNELAGCVTGIHTCIDELLLCAMTLCRYCLPTDQLIIKARCQVVLRETKALLGDLIIGDLDSVFQASQATLKLPVKPSNINVFIDVLKDVLYILETNTNTALLALLVHCFACNVSPVETLKMHFIEEDNECICNDHEDCEFVKEFDLYNERLMQIGSFAISCSSDDQRVLSLRSGLASLEALDPHLVPAVMVAPKSYNASLLIDSWKKEVEDIRDNVFLIVDPSAFAQKANQMMHQKLLEIVKGSSYDNERTCSVINIGTVMKEFFDVYQTHEPDALPDQEKLLPLLQDLNKAQLECKVVSNILSSGKDFLYRTKKVVNNKASFDQLLKRLKLLYTIVNRISTLLGPKENDDQFFEEEQSRLKNDTQTIDNNVNTYVNSPRKTMNMTRSLFGRTTNIRSSTARFPLGIPTQNLKVRKDLSFSVKLDELCNDVSGINVRNTSILYHSPMKNRSSLRKAVLSRHCAKTPGSSGSDGNEIDDVLEEDFMDKAMSLQISDVLNEMNSLTTTKTRRFNLTYDNDDLGQNNSRNNVLNISVNNETVTKQVWNITVNSELSNTSQLSNVDTLERLKDLNLVTSKLSDLRSVQLETSL